MGQLGITRKESLKIAHAKRAEIVHLYTVENKDTAEIASIVKLARRNVINHLNRANVELDLDFRLAIAKMSSLNETHLAYAAALLDGEGSININIANHCMTVTVSMTTPSVINHMYSLYGGSTCELAAQPNRRRAWRWSLGHCQSQAFLTVVKPYVVGKLAQIEIALDYAKLKKEERINQTSKFNAALSEIRYI
jgi:DNA-binding CsgD family transcriptional regulator